LIYRNAGAYSYLQNLSEQQNIDHFRKRDTYNSMGLLLARQGRNQEAKEHHIKSLKLALEFRCPNAAMLTYFYLGQVEHRAALDSQKTPFVRKYYEKGLALAEKLKVRAAAVRCVQTDHLSAFILVCEEILCMKIYFAVEAH
jgi:hypothetical protein